jgi:hypothetical protein
MPTQYTPILKLALPVEGELDGTWGDTVNDNITSMVEQAVAGAATINTWAANVRTLTVADGTTSESRCAALIAQTGTGGTALTAAGQIICPAATKLYVLKNDSAYAVTLKTASGTGVAVPSGTAAFLFCDGTNVQSAQTTLTLPSGTANGVVYLDGSKVATAGAALTFDGTNLGVGTSSPGTRLDVAGAARIRAGNAIFLQNAAADNNATISCTGGSGNNTMSFNSGTMTLDASGNLGIGTSSPSARLQLVAAGDTVLKISPSSSGTARLRLEGTGSGAGAIASASNGLFIVTEDASPMVFSTNNTERMRLDASGNLGIGTTSPAVKLDVVGVAQASTRVVSPAFYGSGTGVTEFMDSLGTTGIYVTGAGASPSNSIRFFSTGTTTATLDSSGNLGIGTSSPTAKLQVYEPTAAATRIRVLANGAQQAALQLAGNGTTFGTTSFDVFQDGGNDAYVANRANASLLFWTNNTERMRLDASGNLGIGVTPSAWAGPYKVVQINNRAALVGNTGGGSYLGNNWYNDGNNKYLGSDLAALYGQLNGQHLWFTAPTGTAGGTITFTQAMTLDANGKLQLNATSTAGGYFTLNTLAQAGLDIYRSDTNAQFNAIRFRDQTNASTYASMGWDSLGLRLDGDAGRILFCTSGTERMRLDASGNLGIGTSSPQTRLHVAITSAGETARFQGPNSSQSSVGLYVSAGLVGSIKWDNGTTLTGTPNSVAIDNGGGVIAFQISGTERMRLDSAGNLGIGTTSPIVALELGRTTADNQIRLKASNGNADLRINSAFAGADVAAMGVVSAHPLMFFTNNIERMRLDASGNLGLGVTPSAWGGGFKALEMTNGSLSINGNGPYINQNAVFTTDWVYKTTAAAAQYYQVVGTHAWLTAPSGTAGNAISFTQAMTLDANGNLLVGTTSASAKLTVNGVSNQVSIRSTVSNSGDINAQLITSQTSGTAVQFYTSGTTVAGSITVSGTSTTYATSSDVRLKENIQDAASASDLIDAIQVRQFDWKSDGSQQRYGMVAQELAQVAPEAVHQPADPEEMMAVDYSKLVPMLIKEIQSLRQRVAQLERV